MKAVAYCEVYQKDFFRQLRVKEVQYIGHMGIDVNKLYLDLVKEKIYCIGW